MKAKVFKLFKLGYGTETVVFGVSFTEKLISGIKDLVYTGN